MRKTIRTRMWMRMGVVTVVAVLAGCQAPPGPRLITHIPSGRMYYTLSDEIETLGRTQQIHFYDRSRKVQVTLLKENAQVEEISKVRYNQAVTRINE
ncbi:MAG: hypothetical protein KAS72_09615 [Phycisphaerales bacterium]|nr:hypothetical protein [Phycisphaerales bacterium]